MLAWMRPRRWWYALAVLALVWQVNTMIDWTLDDYTGYMNERVAYQDNIAHLLQLTREAPGIVLADEYMGLVPLAGKSLYFQPFEYKMMVEAGVWDQVPFLSEIVGKKFDLILWYRPDSWRAVESRWTPQMIDAVNSAYQREQTIGNVWVMRPRR